MNLLLGIPGVVPFFLLWYLAANWPLAELGLTVREPTEDEGMALWLVIIVPVVTLYGLIWWLANMPLRSRTTLAPRTYWLISVLTPLLPTAALFINA